MSALPQTSQTMTEAEYLELERASEFKHEYVGGTVLAMTGASRAHNLISVNVITTLKNQLRGQPCEVYPGDMRVKVEVTRLYTYPDISVVCGGARFADTALDTLVNPTLIIEVLSPSTERYDRGKKFQNYRELESLQEYVLIAQDGARVECYRRQANGIWELRDASGLTAQLELASVGCRLDLAEVYDQITFGEAADEPPK
ncbi:MAG TPA: Uma2 family endonuclease [Phototrophicaceae bacterium]|nr:Uma2 family endonuclease [Phototrophicaceae bacterium]